MSSNCRAGPKKGKVSSLENVVESQKKKKSTVASSSGTSIASGTTSSSSGSKSPARKSRSTKMMVTASTAAKQPTIPEEASAGRTRPRMSRRMSDDTFAFDQNDWNDSETEGFSPVSDGTRQTGNGFLLKNQKNAIQPLTRKVTETEQEWFSEWEDMDGDDPNPKSNPSTKSRIPKDHPVSSSTTTHSSKLWTLSFDNSEATSPTNDQASMSNPPKPLDRKSTAKERSTNITESQTTASRESRSKRSKGDEDVAASRCDKTTGASSVVHDTVHDAIEEPSRRASQTTGNSRKQSKQSSRDEDDIDVSRSGRKKQSTTGSKPDDMDSSRRGSKATKADRALSSSTNAPEDAATNGLDGSAKRSTKSAKKTAEVESHRSSKTKSASESDDMDISRRGGSSSKKPSSKVSSSIDDDMDSSRRGAPSRKSGKDIVSRRTLRRGTSADDDEEDQEESPKKEKKESRLAALRRASVAAASAIDDDRNRRSRTSDEDTISSSRRSASVSRRASVAGDGRIGRDAERRGEEDVVRTRSRSRRSVSRGRAPEKPPPKEKSMLGDSNESDQEEDDVEKLFRKAHADERKFMLDKSRVGPVRALEPASSDDEDEDGDALMTPRRRRKTGYLPTNLNDTSNVHAPTSAATPRRKEGKKSSSRKQSLDDMLFNFAAGPHSSQTSGSASVGYNPTGSGEMFSSSASVPGEMLPRKSVNPADWTKNVDDLLDARRRSHAGDSPRSHKGQLYTSGTTPAAVVSANYANKMRQLQNTRKFSLGGPPTTGTLYQTATSGKATSLVLPLINTSMDTKKKLNPLGIRRPTMI